MRQGWMLLPCLPLIAGCALAPAGATLPVGSSVVRDQLVVHSDFSLPHRHRLLEDLTALRIDMGLRLDLPVSDEPIHVYLFDDSQAYQSYMAENYRDFPDRRAFFVETDTRLAVYAYWGDRVAEDLRHELAHGYLHSVTPNVPLWLDEGLAEYYEMPRGSQGFHPAHIELLTNRRHELGWSPDLRRLEKIAAVAQLTQQDYAEAWLWCHFLLETSPGQRAVIQSYLAELRRRAVAPPFSQVLSATRRDPEQLLLRHLESLAAGAAPLNAPPQQLD